MIISFYVCRFMGSWITHADGGRECRQFARGCQSNMAGVVVFDKERREEALDGLFGGHNARCGALIID
jgi:hypothetical protein